MLLQKGMEKHQVLKKLAQLNLIIIFYAKRQPWEGGERWEVKNN